MIYYFEVKINDIGQRGLKKHNIQFFYNIYQRDISIGLAGPDFPLNKHPGTTKKYFYLKKKIVLFSKKHGGQELRI